MCSQEGGGPSQNLLGLRRPQQAHAHTQLLVTWSKDMAASAGATAFPPAQSKRAAVRRMSAAA